MLRALPGLLAAGLAGALACAGSTPLQPIESPIRAKLPASVEISIETRIQGSLPEVHYDAPPASVFGAGPAGDADSDGSLDSDEVRALLLRLESLHGGRIVCRPSADRVYGDCVFPNPGDGALHR